VIVPGLLALLSPIVATLLGVLVVGESFTLVQVAGIVITLAALVGGQFAARPRGTPATTVDPSAAPVAVR